MEFRTFVEAQGRQTRTFTTELRALGGGGMGAGDEFALVGYAAKFDNLSKDLGGFKEKIQSGAFSRSLREKADVKALFNHAPDNILGRTKSGTLQLNEDGTGLCFRCQLNPRSQAHRELYESVKRGDISECSFAFTVPVGGDQWTSGIDSDTGKEISMRTLVDVDLMDVSVVTYPAYDNTGVAARSEKFGYTRKQPVVKIEERLMRMLTLLQKTERAVGRALSHAEATALLAAQRDTSSTYQSDDHQCTNPAACYHCMHSHLRTAYDLAECSYSIATQVNDLLDNWPGTNGGDMDEEDSLRAKSPKAKARAHNALRRMHREAHRMLGETCALMHQVRLQVGQIFD